MQEGPRTVNQEDQSGVMAVEDAMEDPTGGEQEARPEPQDYPTFMAQDSEGDDQDDGASAVDVPDDSNQVAAERPHQSAARRLEVRREAGHSAIEQRRLLREQERAAKAAERSAKWRGRWDRFKGGVKNAWDTTKKVVGEVPNLPSHSMDLVDKARDYSADKAVGLAARASRSIDARTTAWGEDLVATKNFLDGLVPTLKSSFNQERLNARKETIQNRVDAMVSGRVELAPQEAGEIGKQVDKAIALESRIAELQEQLDAITGKQGKTKKAGNWLRSFLN